MPGNFETRKIDNHLPSLALRYKILWSAVDGEREAVAVVYAENL